MYAHKHILGLPILTLDNGKEIGRVKKVVISPENYGIAALVVEQKSGFFRDTKVITYDYVCHVGKDAITVSETNCIKKASTLPEIFQLLKNENKLSDVKVMTVNGTNLGNIEEYYFDLVSGAIVSLEITTTSVSTVFQGKKFLDASYIHKIGKDVLMVKNEAVENIKKVDSTFQKEYRKIQAGLSSFWVNLKEKSKNLKENIEKFAQEEELLLEEEKKIKEQKNPQDISSPEIPEDFDSTNKDEDQKYA